MKRIYQTSGTSGSPSLIALTAADLHTWRTIGTRSYYATGIREHNSVLITFGAGPFVVGHIHGVLEDLGARTVPIGPGDTDRVLTAFEHRIVDTMLTTPSYALYLIERYERSGVDAQSLGLIHFITGGEPGGGLPGIRSRIEDAFAADVTEAMGLGDITPSLFGECPAKNGMHFGGDGLVWPELVDQSGHPLEIEAGAEGELVYTHLQREAMPLVRFRSGDYIKILTTNCPCGRTSFTIRISGRIDDMFIVRGVNVYPSAVQAIVAGFMPEVTGRMRVVLEETGIAVAPPVPIEVEISDGAEINSDLPERIAATIRERLSFRATITLLPQGSFGSAAYKTGAIRRES